MFEMWKKAKYSCLIILLLFSVAYGQVDIKVFAPKEVYVGEWFTVNVSILSNESRNFSVYSYVYRGLDVVSQGWTANMKEVEVHPNEYVNLSLSDLVKIGTADGIYNLKVKVRCSSECYNYTTSLKVINKQSIIKENYLYFILLMVSILGLVLIYFSRR